MQLPNIRKAIWDSIKAGLILCTMVIFLAIVLSTYTLVGMCIDMVVHVNDYNSCDWVLITVFFVFLSLLIIVSWYSARQLSKFDLMLSLNVIGLVVSLFFIETLTWLNEYGAMLPVFATILGFLVAGRARKIPWKPRTQFLALMLIMIASGWLYVFGPNYIEIPQLINSTESLPASNQFIFRLAIELIILVAMMCLSEEAKKWLQTKI